MREQPKIIFSEFPKGRGVKVRKTKNLNGLNWRGF